MLISAAAPSALAAKYEVSIYGALCLSPLVVSLIPFPKHFIYWRRQGNMLASAKVYYDWGDCGSDGRLFVK